MSWLNIQWASTSAFFNRGAEEEKAGYIRLAENVIVNLVAAESAREGGDDKEWEIVWISAAERLISQASEDAGEFRGASCVVKLIMAHSDTDRLESLARIVLRLSSMTRSSEVAANLLPAIMNRIIALDPDGGKDGKVSKQTIEHLFRASLSLEPGDMTERMPEAVKEIGLRVSSLDGEVGDWFRRERRRAKWDTMKSD